MICNNCGTNNLENAKFCNECGAVLSGFCNNQSNQIYVKNPIKGKSKMLLGAALTILGFLLTIGAANQDTGIATFGVVMLIVGIIIIIVGKIQHWYHWK